MRRLCPRMCLHRQTTGMVSQNGQGQDLSRVIELRCWAPMTLKSSRRTVRADSGCDHDKRSLLQEATKHISMPWPICRIATSSARCPVSTVYGASRSRRKRFPRWMKRHGRKSKRCASSKGWALTSGTGRREITWE